MKNEKKSGNFSEKKISASKNQKMSPKGRTDLKIWPSKAKNLEELDFDVRKSLAPRKSAENKKPKKKIEKKKSAKKKRNLQIVWNARCRSFAPIGAKFEG